MKPFSIIGFSIDDDVLCHDCLVATATVTGEVLHHTCSTRSRSNEETVCPACRGSDAARAERQCASPILPLYFADEAVREELCTYCHRALLDLALRNERQHVEPRPGFGAHKASHAGRYPAVQFDRRPPAEVRAALKTAGWRWDPARRHWWHPSPEAPVPSSVCLPPDHPRIAARPPLIRKRAAPSAVA
jgi:hypothetical protein